MTIVANRARKLSNRVLDEVRFLRSWVERPLTTGAVTPSSPALAKLMASMVDVDRPGLIIELGPGTGVVTKALIKHGVHPNRMIALEFNAEFCKLLDRRHPQITIVEADAYDLANQVKGLLDSQPVAAVVSSLPLLTRPSEQRHMLLDQALDLLAPGAPFIQFSYAVAPPIAEGSGDFVLERTNWVVLNIPPARVWAYRRPARPIHGTA